MNVQILGRPRPASEGGARLVETRCGEKAVIAALPFASPGAWAGGTPRTQGKATYFGIRQVAPPAAGR